MPRIRPLGPPPYDRPNWGTMNEGQRRYAMEQYSLARVRRGEQVVDDDYLKYLRGEEQEDEDFDIDAFVNNVYDENFAGGNNEEPSDDSDSLPDTQESGVDDFLDQVRSRQESEMEVDPVSSSSGGGGGVKRGGAVQGGRAAKANKQGDTRSHGSALPGTSGNTDGMEESTATGGAQGVPHVFRAPRINILSQTFRYEKQWKFTSFGIAPQIIKTTAGTEWGLTSSLVAVPWEYLFMYMSPAEYNRSIDFPGFHAVSCHIRITQFNPRVAFNTGETLSQTATLNQNKFLLLAKGLKQIDYMKILDSEYVYDTTEPMKPTAFATTTGQASRDSLKTYMYGLDNNSSIFTSIVPTAATGAELELLRYATCFIPVSDGSQLAGFPPFNNHVEEYNAMDFVGKPILEESYKFKYAPIQAARSIITDVNTTGSASLNYGAGNDNEIQKIKTYNVTNDNVQQADFANNLTRKVNNGAVNSYFNDSTNVYTKYPLEQDAVFFENNDRAGGHSQQPSLHVGVRAVPKLTTVDNSRQASSWLDTQMYYYVTCELICKSDDKYPRLKRGPYNVPSKAQFQAQNAGNTSWYTTNYDLQNMQGRHLLSTVAV